MVPDSENQTGDVSDALIRKIRASEGVARTGRISAATGTVIRATGLSVRIGQVCHLKDPVSDKVIRAEVLGVDGKDAILGPLDPVFGLSIGAEVHVAGEVSDIPCSQDMVGRVLNAEGRPIDGKGPVQGGLTHRPLYCAPPNPMQRKIIDRPISTGVRIIDSLLTTGEGQRMGIFASAGVGKSTLLGMLARNSDADVIVIGLIGERGREVQEMIQDNLGEEGLRKSVIVVATSDQPAMERARAAHCATTVAEYFRDQGLRVMLLLDSVTRFARALREIGLASGEAPTRRGFPSMVFAELPRLLERAGQNENGSITAFYTVLVEDETEEDPIAEEVRSILDGHIVMRRALAERGQFPAIDPLKSVSRLFSRITSEPHQEAAVRARNWMAKAEEMDFLIKMGEYKGGQDEVDLALEKAAHLAEIFRQRVDEVSSLTQSQDQLGDLCR